MILSDKSLKNRLIKGDIVIDPLPDLDKIQSCSIDLHLGDKLLKYVDSTLDIRKPLRYTEYYLDENGIKLAPGECVLGYTQERIKVPSDLACTVSGKSTNGRVFLTVHSTAGHVDPGFNGNVTLEITNLNLEKNVVIYKDMLICQVLFTELTDECDRPYGSKGLNNHYQNQKGVQPCYNGILKEGL